jgi:hypothetical protein
MRHAETHELFVECWFQAAVFALEPGGEEPAAEDLARINLDRHVGVGVHQ